jgi:hypothetical protein
MRVTQSANNSQQPTADRNANPIQAVEQAAPQSSSLGQLSPESRLQIRLVIWAVLPQQFKGVFINVKKKTVRLFLT